MKRLFVLIIIGVCSTLTVFLGSFIAADRTKYHNAFTRVFPSHAADLNSSLKVKKQSFLAGLSAAQVYLRDRSGILVVSSTLTDSIRIRMDIPFGAEIVIDSPHFYIHNASFGTLQRGYMANWTIDTTFTPVGGFTAIQPMSANDAVIRTMNISKRQNLLAKLHRDENYVLEKQIDGLLCTDGFLLYSKELDQLVYLYRYRNEFLCLDTDLKLIRRGNTIDTTSVAKISIAEIEGKITMVTPPLNVNNNACVNGKYLFVSSNLVARNETSDAARNKTVIDVYNLLDGSYRFSFYVANQDSRVQEFRVHNNKLVAVFKTSVSTYDIPAIYLP